MCGIVGKLFHDPQRPVRREILDAMTDRLAHRGPDARGVFVDGSVGLGHRRLSIIDLSADGSQPMPGLHSTMLTFNGEIYNFAEIRRDLEARGRVFRSRSDSEVILALYEDRGERCVEALWGMFAFAIWDGRRRRLFCARDRLGKKPFYYYADSSTFSFASELGALLADPDVPRRVDWPAVHDYLTLHYVPSPETAFQNVSKIPPAHCLTVEDGQVSLRRYWQASFEPKVERPEAELAEELWHLIEDATRLRLVSDVPLGAFLSGGTDSSAVVAAMSQITGRAVKTFSIGFREAAFNELPDAARTAERYHTDHHELLVTPDASEVLPELVRHHGEPFADPSSIPTYYVARLARSQVTVALSGDGGDEAFGGYTRYTWARYLEVAAQLLPEPVRRAGVAAVRWLGRRSLAPGWLRLAAQYAGDLTATTAERYLSLAGHFPPWERPGLYTADMTAELARSDRRETVDWFRASSEAGDARQFLDRLVQNDLVGYLADGIMVKVDIASMIHSLEVRAPLLDHRIVEFGARLPVHLKQKGFARRVLYKQAVARHLPPEILNRPKRGLGIPVGDWLRGPLRPMLQDLVLDGLSQRGMFRPEALRTLVDNHVARRTNHGHRLWNLCVLELWLRNVYGATAVPQ